MSKDIEERKRKTRITPESPRTSIAVPRQEVGLLRGLDDIFYDFRRSFDDLMRPFFPFSTEPFKSLELPVKYPTTDLIDNGDSYTVKAELPGFTKDMVEVQVNKDSIEVKAEMKAERENNGKNYLHRERTYSSVQRVIGFPEEVISSKTEGSLKDGILEIRVPKKEPKPEEKKHKVELK